MKTGIQTYILEHRRSGLHQIMSRCRRIRPGVHEHVVERGEKGCVHGLIEDHAATCELAWGRTGMSLALRGTRIFFARSSSTATRQRGTKPERFQLCTVVSGMPVPFEMAVTPPSASKMSDTLSMHPNYDIRNCHARV